ncbi:long-chain fatty acid--CoA ligase [Pseudomonas neustonica]|uniref:Long-chain fatty acid--CoA ligase n=1 Tax=Pseudomonas neustonica TaxID=2487346 RepID=A0ABX9XIQ8_9PSED|nr:MULTISPECIES: long-chain-fatty-acid--CoA ligase [Pseudomonas]ROZ83465.1 long-chain fatty acid--CoA ligase [Pseudomonas sp. SSM44]ROZ85323.1 long-chain fatty acid--CoA ligase [Pseudomonas neustonica]|tara:strand:- start:70 stop:1734 length:1665 start_codon:yes stop_codon:yes gene_type:complete
MFDRHYAVWPDQVPKQLEVPATNLFHNITVSALRYPDHPAIHYYGSNISYRELQNQAERLAGYLQQAGVKNGDRVLLYMQNSPQYIIGYFAILRANAVVVPVNPMNRTAELAYLIEDTQAPVALCGQELSEFVAPHIGESALKEVIVTAYSEYVVETTDLTLPDAVAAPAEPVTAAGLTAWQAAMKADIKPSALTAGPNDLCVIPYSSGTTGNPKGCVHTHHSAMATTVYGAAWVNTQHSCIHLVSVPMFHVTGMQSCMNSTLYAGGTLVVMTRWDRKVAAQLIESLKINTWRNISTMVVDMLSDPDIDQYDIRSLTGIGGGGAAMPAAVAKKLQDKTGLIYMEGYGLSETIAATHANPPHACKPQCLGVPFIGVDSRVIDVDTLKEVEPGVTGEIIMRGEQIFQGYWNRPDATEEAFVEVAGERFFRSGDLGYYDEEGYFFLVDRVKRMINASGFKVWPAEVESLMYAHPAIQEVCIISVPHERRGETVKAVVVLSAGKQDTTEQDIINWCQENMAAYKCPQIVSFADSIPKSPTGKIMWRHLQDIEWGRAEA